MPTPWYWLGQVPYNDAFKIQREYRDEVIAGTAPSALFLLEHPPVLTLGANFHTENLLKSVTEYEAQGIEVIRTDRGGDVTFHGPGQLVAYPIFDLKLFGKDLHLWLRNLEEAFIEAAAKFGLEGVRFPPHTGVWIGSEKLAAIGVKVSKWVSIHGVAMNCDNDLEVFDSFIPCGIQDYGVTSLSAQAGRAISVQEAIPAVLAGFESTFGIVFESKPWPKSL